MIIRLTGCSDNKSTTPTLMQNGFTTGFSQFLFAVFALAHKTRFFSWRSIGMWRRVAWQFGPVVSEEALLSKKTAIKIRSCKEFKLHIHTSDAWVGKTLWVLLWTFLPCSAPPLRHGRVQPIAHARQNSMDVSAKQGIFGEHIFILFIFSS
jgi:hypothetical protein